MAIRDIKAGAGAPGRGAKNGAGASGRGAKNGAVAPAPPSPHSRSPMTHGQILIVMSGLMLGVFLAALDQTIIATALPTITGHLGGLRHLSWVVIAYLLTSTISTPIYGKISDLIGRKGIFQFSIVIFLIGSALCGLSQNIWELVGFRAVQGLGGGGIMALAMAIMGDIVSPRERGKYQGYFGAVFTLSSIVGPLLGGILVDQVSWRWIFYINVPVGIVALIVTSAKLNFPFTRREHRVDYVGTALLFVSVSLLLVVTVWGGTQYPWSSPTIISMLVVGVVGCVLFGWWERRVPEPILPPHLFRNPIVVVSSSITFILALTMLGAVIYLPVYLQLVRGMSPTNSGLMLIPIMLGMIGTSIVTGNLVSRLGRYKIFPVIGTVLMTAGMYLMSTIRVDTSYVSLGLKMVVLGMGMGMIMQVMVISTQNAVDPRDLGTATSMVSFFRNLGGAFGTAMFGAILFARLGYWLLRLLPPAVASHLRGHIATIVASPSQVHALPPAMRSGVQEAFVRSLHVVFLAGIPLSAVTIVLALSLKELRLRSATDATTEPLGSGTDATATQVS